jgi:NH3-dependent NAD+ synthetase
MRNLAARFVRSDISANAKQIIHVVDPYLDFRERLSDLKTLKQNVGARKINVDVEQVAKRYAKWWNNFQQVLSVSAEENVRTHYC